MQLQVLCRVMEWKQEEVAALQAEKTHDIHSANTIVRDEHYRSPNLPVEIILRIFSFLYWSDRRSKTIKRLLNDPKTSRSWGNAIRKQLPFVIAEGEEHLETCLTEMGLGPDPEFVPLGGDLESLSHRSNNLSLVLTDIPTNEDALIRALHQPLHQLTLHLDVSYAVDNRLPRMIISCRDVIPKLRYLVVKQEAPYTRSYEEAVLLGTHGNDWRVEEWERARKDSKLRFAVIPMAFIQPLTPVLNNLEELELTVPAHIVEFSAFADILKLLPASLLVLKLCDSTPFWKDPPRFAELTPHSEGKLLHLKELKISNFIPRVSQAIMRTIVCPQLESFSIDMMGTAERHDEKLELSFVSDIYPELRVLQLYPENLLVSRHPGYRYQLF